MQSKSLLILCILALAHNRFVHGQSAITDVKRANNDPGAAFGIVNSAPRDGSRPEPFQRAKDGGRGADNEGQQGRRALTAGQDPQELTRRSQVAQELGESSTFRRQLPAKDGGKGSPPRGGQAGAKDGGQGDNNERQGGGRAFPAGPSPDELNRRAQVAQEFDGSQISTARRQLPAKGGGKDGPPRGGKAGAKVGRRADNNERQTGGREFIAGQGPDELSRPAQVAQELDRSKTSTARRQLPAKDGGKEGPPRGGKAVATDGGRGDNNERQGGGRASTAGQGPDELNRRAQVAQELDGIKTSIARRQLPAKDGGKGGPPRGGKVGAKDGGQGDNNERQGGGRAFTAGQGPDELNRRAQVPQKVDGSQISTARRQLPAKDGATDGPPRGGKADPNEGGRGADNDGPRGRRALTADQRFDEVTRQAELAEEAAEGDSE